MDWEKTKLELKRKLDPKHIRAAPRGKFGDYVDIHHVISEANRIFGEDGWSYTITRIEKVSDATFTVSGKDQVRVGYMATVLVVVDGVTREGAAVGSGSGKPENVADLHESAVKEAESDALKRALRTFGNTFGLALYDKDKADVGVTPVELTPEQKSDAALSKAKQIAAALMDAPSDADAREQWDRTPNSIEAIRGQYPQHYQIIVEAAIARGIIGQEAA